MGMDTDTDTGSSRSFELPRWVGSKGMFRECVYRQTASGRTSLVSVIVMIMMMMMTRHACVLGRQRQVNVDESIESNRLLPNKWRENGGLAQSSLFQPRPRRLAERLFTSC